MTAVRPLTPRDLEAVQELLLDSFSTRLHPYLTYTQRGIDRFLGLRLEHAESFPGSIALVACDQRDEVVGFADFRVGEESGFLSYICVSAQARRSGVATSLINGLFEMAPPGMSRVELDVFDQSRAALRMYESLGFVPTSRQVWVTRTLPLGSSAVAVASIKDVHASQAVYGFCDFALAPPRAGRRFGILGGLVLRCFDAADLVDDAVLAELKATFPGLATAFTLAPEATAADLLGAYDTVNRSTRLALTLPSAGFAAQEGVG